MGPLSFSKHSIYVKPDTMLQRKIRKGIKTICQRRKDAPVGNRPWASGREIALPQKIIILNLMWACSTVLLPSTGSPRTRSSDGRNLRPPWEREEWGGVLEEVECRRKGGLTHLEHWRRRWVEADRRCFPLLAWVAKDAALGVEIWGEGG
uniref:Uncharacterized protein n=1 Tax=Aegilops tauschii TaxID=37682 RepID=M8BQL6_AEGTA